MLRINKHRESTANKTRRILLGLFLVLPAWSKVAVLLFFLASSGVVRPDHMRMRDTILFEFTSEFYIPMGKGRIDGLMASDGSRYRIAIYWIEPSVYRDHTFFLGFSDFIFSENQVQYWIHGVAQPGILDLSDEPSKQLLPRDVSVESMACSALTIAKQIRSNSLNEETPPELGKFLRESRDHAEYSYEVPSKQISEERLSDNRTSDVEILNALPFGRKYSKQIQPDGIIVWSAERVLDGPHVARVTVKPILKMEMDDASMFDPDTLSQWTLVPEPYRAYWSFDREYFELKDAPENVGPARELNDKIESYLDNNEVPDRVSPVLHQLRFKTAILTGDVGRVSRSAQAFISTLCNDVSTNSYQRMLEMARIDAQVREQYPGKVDDLVRPLAAPIIRHSGPDAQRTLERLMPKIESNKWFQYGNLLVEEMISQSLIEEDAAEKLDTRLESAHLAREISPAYPNEMIPSVKRYLARIDSEPPPGTLTMEDISDIIEKGLKKAFTVVKLDSRDEVVESTVRSIRLIAGEGPFKADKGRLIKSVQRFSGLYLVVDRTSEPIDAVLATFLALSFCDTSTTKDHDALFSQICILLGELQSVTDRMLAERGLSELVTPDDVERIFDMYKRIFRRYIDDPLWPAFKFPLTDNEETRLRNKLKLRFDQLEPLFKEISLKVKYGGVSEELKQKTVYEITRAAQALLPETAFLRRPPYPGVWCQYLGKYGFTAGIRGPLYKEGERPREKFKAMKYFHLGHRLEEVVKRERELVRR